MKAKIIDFEEINIGDTAAFSRTITEDDLKKYSEISGDYNPLHLSDSYAEKTEFGGRVVYGMFLGALVSRLVGMELPGAKALLVKECLEFRKPARVGDRIEVKAEVAHKSRVGRLVELTVTINRGQELLVSGKVYAKVLK